MKWRRDTRLLGSPPSLTLNLDLGCRASGPRARGCERVYRRCRQFWSNICPRKNKSPLSLTTGRASLVSNRALLNRRRITDPRVARPFRLSAPSFRSRSTSPIVVSSSADLFSPRHNKQQNETRLAFYHRVFPGFLSKILSSFLPSLFLPPSLFRSLLSFAFDDCQSRTSAIKISRSCEECGARLSRPRTRVLDTPRLCGLISLPVLPGHSSGEKREAADT